MSTIFCTFVGEKPKTININKHNTIMEKSKLQVARAAYQPKLPGALKGPVVAVEGAATQSVGNQEEIKAMFPNTYGMPVITFEDPSKSPLKGETSLSESSPLRGGLEGSVGIILSGGQAPGGHNVISGLYDGVKSLSKESKLYGFLMGPGGLVDHKYVEFTDDFIDEYRNTGGFDIIGSGRTKLEKESQFESGIEILRKLGIKALVIIGGDDSNTNACVLAEYYAAKQYGVQVIGCPKTIDGDLKNEQIETSFGFDTACKTYSELIGNIQRDCNSARKYWHFIKLMGRSASHIALECALQTQPNVCLISEEVEQREMSLDEVVTYIAKIVADRAADGNNFGMATWSLMDYGCYNGPSGYDGNVPCAYTAYEMFFSGWMEPTELARGCEVSGMAAITDRSEGYIIYNDKFRDEYYVLTNIQQKSWNRYAYGHGLLVTHVDYSEDAWYNNVVNNTKTRQRCTIIPADNATPALTSSAATWNSLSGDPFPGTSQTDSLTDTGKPAAILYNNNSEGKKVMGKPLTDIKEADGLISFVFNGGTPLDTPVATDATDVGCAEGPLDELPVEESPTVAQDEAPQKELATFAELYEAVGPAKGAQKATVAGYWLESRQGQQSWKASEVNKLLKSIDVRVSSMSIVLTNAVKAASPLVVELSRLGDSERSRKTFRLSELGTAYVEDAIGRPRP